eukprot:scaffold131467_cov85-Attheya_sp.AAC.1
MLPLENLRRRLVWSLAEFPASHAVDGNVDGMFWNGTCSHTRTLVNNPWWQVDLEGPYEIHDFFIYNRIVDCCSERLLRLQVKIFLDGSVVWSSRPTVIVGNPVVVIINVSPIVQGDTVKLSIPGMIEYLSMPEVQWLGSLRLWMSLSMVVLTHSVRLEADTPDSFDG